MMEYTSPGGMSKLKSSIAFKPPNFLPRPSTRSRLMLAASSGTMQCKDRTVGVLAPSPGSHPRFAGPLLLGSCAPRFLVVGCAAARFEQARQAGHHAARQKDHGAHHDRAEHHHLVVL